MAIKEKIKDTLGLGKPDYVKVEDKNRFYYMLQQMQNNRWNITLAILFLFFFIIAGINSAVFFNISIGEDWKELLLILRILIIAFCVSVGVLCDFFFHLSLIC